MMRPAINGSIFGEDSLRLDENPRERERSAEPQFVGRKQLILLWIFVSITFVLIIGLGAFAYKAWRDAQQLRYDTARITQEIQANLRQETEAIRTSLGPILQTAKHADQTAAELKGSLEELANSHQGLSDQVRRLAQRVRQEEKQAPATTSTITGTISAPAAKPPTPQPEPIAESPYAKLIEQQFPKAQRVYHARGTEDTWRLPFDDGKGGTGLLEVQPYGRSDAGIYVRDVASGQTYIIRPSGKWLKIP